MASEEPRTVRKVSRVYEALALATFALAILAALTIYPPVPYTGVLGKTLAQLSKGLFGVVAFLLPPLLLLFTADLLLNKRRQLTLWRVWHYTFLALLIGALAQVITVPLADFLSFAARSDSAGAGVANNALPSTAATLGALWELGQEAAIGGKSLGAWSGGFCGGLVAMALVALSSRTGAIIIIGAAIAIEAVLIFNLSFAGLGIKLGQALRNVVSRLRHAFENWRFGRAERKALSEAEAAEAARTAQAVAAELAATGEGVPGDDEDPTNNTVVPAVTFIPGVVTNGRSGSKTAAAHMPPVTLWQQSAQESRSERTDQAVAPAEAPPLKFVKPERSKSGFILVGTDAAPQSDEAESPALSWNGATLPEAAHDPIYRQLTPPRLEPSKRPEIRVEASPTIIPTRSTSKNTEGTVITNWPRKAPMLERTAGRMSLEDVTFPARTETAAEVSAIPPRTEPRKTKETAVRSGAQQAGKKASPPIVPAESEPKSKPAWKLPPINLLSPEPAGKTATNVKVVRDLGRRLEETLASFGVEAKVTNITSGPTITRFELMPGVGVKVSRIVSLSDDIALSLAATGLRIEAPIPGKSVIGIEMANKEIGTVGIRELLADEQFRNSRVPLLAALGRDVAGAPIYCDLTKMPHLLIAGATGSGKSVCINAILTSILSRMSPEDLRLILIDPKVVELSVYADIPHLVEPVVTEPEKAAKTLGAVVREMDARYNIFAECGVRDLAGYNEYAKRDGLEHMPFWVVVIDELADLMMTAANEVESYIARLTAKARAAGIHLIVATQRPSVDVITGLIKANIPSRIAFAVASQVDSRTVLDMGGAEKLLGRGDMLYSPQHLSKPIRGQGAFISVRDVEKFTSYIKAQGGPRYSEEHMEVVDELLSGSGDRSGEDEMDELLPDAAQICLDAGYGSISILQRRLNVGYPRAARLIDTLEQMGWVGPRDGSRPRKLQFDQTMLEQFKRGQQ